MDDLQILTRACEIIKLNITLFSTNKNVGVGSPNEVVNAIVDLGVAFQEIEIVNPLAVAITFVALHLHYFTNNDIRKKFVKLVPIYDTLEQYEKQIVSTGYYSTTTLQKLIEHEFLVLKEKRYVLGKKGIEHLVTRTGVDDFLSNYPVTTKVGTKIIALQVLPREVIYAFYIEHVITKNLHNMLIETIVKAKALGLPFINLVDFLNGGYKYYIDADHSIVGILKEKYPYLL